MVRAKVHRRQTYSSESLQNAVDYVNSGAASSISEAARKFKVQRGTLRNRVKNLHQPANQSQEAQQHLTSVEEGVLCDWIIYRSDTADPMDKKDVIDAVDEIIEEKPSPRWLRRFLKRHPHIRLGKVSGLDPKRAQCFNRKTVNDHFVELGQVLDAKKIPWRNVYNMDEKGCQRGRGRRMQAIKYFVPRNRRPRYKLRSANLELITIIECVCADGSSLKPGFIFPGKEYHPEWFTNSDPDISVGMSENGWTDDFLCTEWFRDTFIPQAKARNVDDAPILLIYDGHGSHTTPEMRQLAEENGIELFLLPPHTTHRLQPLDVGVFGPFQRRWQERCDIVLSETGEEIRKTDFIKEYMVAREQSFLPETIKSAWKKSGICPLNPDIFTDKDFAPSISTSTHGHHLPDSYPAVFRDSDDDLESEDDGTETESEHEDFDDETFGLDGNPSLLPPPPPPSAVSPAPTSTAAATTATATATTTAAAAAAATTAAPAPAPAPAPAESRSAPAPAASRSPLLALSLSNVPDLSKKRKRADIETENAVFRSELDRLRRENEGLRMHARMAGLEVDSIAKRANTNSRKKEELPTMPSKARWLTGEKGRAEWEQQEREIEVKRQKKAEFEARKEQADTDRQQRRREIAAGRVTFAGAVSSKKVEDLRDIVYALGIKEDGLKDVLLASIKAELDQRSDELRSNARFVGLYTRGRHRHPPTQDIENIPPAAPHPPPFSPSAQSTPPTGVHHTPHHIPFHASYPYHPTQYPMFHSNHPGDPGPGSQATFRMPHYALAQPIPSSQFYHNV